RGADPGRPARQGVSDQAERCAMSMQLTRAGRLVLDPSALQAKSLELLEIAEKDPKRVAERMAAAEAHLRLVVSGHAREKAPRFLDRAKNLDPYRAETYLLSGI